MGKNINYEALGIRFKYNWSSFFNKVRFIIFHISLFHFILTLSFSQRWTCEYCALAVGWEKRGISVWTIYGCRLFSTVPQLESSKQSLKGAIPNNNNNNNGNDSNEEERSKIEFNEEAAKNGVSSICWGTEGYSLFACLNGDSQIIEFNFVKSCSASSPNLNNSERILLQSREKLMMIQYETIQTRSSGPEKQSRGVGWTEIPFPIVYLNDNFPVRLVSLSHDNSKLAVSGRKGFSIFKFKTNRWSLIGDRNHEQSLECFGLCWFRDFLIVGNIVREPAQQNNNNSNSSSGGFFFSSSSSSNSTSSSNQSNQSKQIERYEVLIYNHSQLDASKILLKYSLPKRKPLFFDCNENYLVLFTKDYFFYQFQIITTQEGNGMCLF